MLMNCPLLIFRSPLPSIKYVIIELYRLGWIEGIQWLQDFIVESF